MNTHWQYIRVRAKEQRTQYEIKLGQSVAYPLDVGDLAECVHQMTAFKDPSLNKNINGLLDAERQTIRLNSDMDPLRSRFVTAHEIGHYVLQGKGAGIVIDDDMTINERVDGGNDPDGKGITFYSTRERHEQDANLFALELLVPAEDLWYALQQPEWSIEGLATIFGVSQDVVRTQIINVCCLEPLATLPSNSLSDTSLALDVEQRTAVDSPLPALIIAGPGTGKTRCIVGKYLALLENGVHPSQILTLTFSNKAAEEMHSRIIAALRGTSPDLQKGVDVTTFHAWGLNFLKSYGHHIGLKPNFRLLTPGDLFIFLRERIDELPLESYKNLPNPGLPLKEILSAIGRIKDELWSASEYIPYAEVAAKQVIEEAELIHAGKTTKKAQEAIERAHRKALRLQEVAIFYEYYEMLLQQEGIVDYGDLIGCPAKILALPEIAAHIQSRYHYILVDEFQDVNYASGVLLSRLDSQRGRVWAVADPWQSIYGFRGASPANLQDFDRIYPSTSRHTLSQNYRSLQPILDASRAIMETEPLAQSRPPQRAKRSCIRHKKARVKEWVASCEADELSAIAHDILARTRKSRTHQLPCMRQDVPRKRKRFSRLTASDTKKAWKFRDHVVLCRKHDHAEAVVRVLQAHNIPVEWVGDIFEYPVIKDVLAVCGLVRSNNSASFLRAITLKEYEVGSEDLARLVQMTYEQRLSLPRATRQSEILSQISNGGQSQLQRLHMVVRLLSSIGDAWQVLAEYLFTYRPTTRKEILKSAQGNFEAKFTLQLLGQLLVIAKNFVLHSSSTRRDFPKFIEYLRLLIEVGEVPKAPRLSLETDAVQVMTVHAAKGLEFPIVYIPFLIKDQFPTKERQNLPIASKALHGITPEHQQEERYLLHVAMTRARNFLFLSRTEAEARSSLLPNNEDSLWKLQYLARADHCPVTKERVRLRHAVFVPNPVPASSLQTYQECPRRFLYQYGFQLYDNVSPYLLLHQVIREAVSSLVSMAKLGMLPENKEELRTWIWEIFKNHQLDEISYKDDYFQLLYLHTEQLWNELSQGNMIPEEIGVEMLLERDSGTVSLRVDQIYTQDDKPLWVRMRSGKPQSDDHLKIPVIVNALAYRQYHNDSPHLALHYTSTNERNVIKIQEKVLENHAHKLDTILSGIRTGQWEPRPSQQCTTCSFNLICPI